jgi:hypothetical protein
MFEIVLALVPLLLLLVSLLLGHYPGYGAIVRLSERLASPRPRMRGAGQSSRPRPPLTHAAGGGLLIALGIATRPPPLAAAS